MFTLCPVHDWMCVCERVASRLFFYTEVIYGMSLFGCYCVCLYSVFLNTVTALAKHVHIERMEETKIYCHTRFFFFFFILLFLTCKVSIFVSWTETWNVGGGAKKSCWSFLYNLIMSNIWVFVIFVCMYESFVNLWLYARFGKWVYVSSKF